MVERPSDSLRVLASVDSYSVQTASAPRHVSFFFFLVIRRPPRSTLFPYRRSSDLRCSMWWPRCCARAPGRRPEACAGCSTRSEEHTSELQSLTNLVCRLLLEKKNECSHLMSQ